MENLLKETLCARKKEKNSIENLKVLKPSELNRREVTLQTESGMEACSGTMYIVPAPKSIAYSSIKDFCILRDQEKMYQNLVSFRMMPVKNNTEKHRRKQRGLSSHWCRMKEKPRFHHVRTPAMECLCCFLLEVLFGKSGPKMRCWKAVLGFRRVDSHNSCPTCCNTNDR